MRRRSSSDQRTDAVRTRAALLEAALPEFAEHGFDGANVRRIAAAAGVNMAMAFYHFTDKAGLYDATVGRMVEIALIEFSPVMDEVERRFAESIVDPAECSALAGMLVAPFLRMSITEASVAWGKLMLREQLQPSRAFPILHERLVARLIDLLATLLACAESRARMPADDSSALAMYGEAMIFLTNHASVAALLGERRSAPGFVEVTTNAIVARHFSCANPGAH